MCMYLYIMMNYSLYMQLNKLNVCFAVYIYIYIYIYIYAKQNTWGVKKYEAKKNQRLKTLISNKAKKSVNESAT